MTRHFDATGGFKMTIYEANELAEELTPLGLFGYGYELLYESRDGTVRFIRTGPAGEHELLEVN